MKRIRARTAIIGLYDVIKQRSLDREGVVCFVASLMHELVTIYKETELARHTHKHLVGIDSRPKPQNDLRKSSACALVLLGATNR
jgi:hypothetical protein